MDGLPLGAVGFAVCAFLAWVITAAVRGLVETVQPTYKKREARPRWYLVAMRVLPLCVGLCAGYASYGLFFNSTSRGLACALGFCAGYLCRDSYDLYRKLRDGFTQRAVAAVSGKVAVPPHEDDPT